MKKSYLLLILAFTGSSQKDGELEICHLDRVHTTVVGEHHDIHIFEPDSVASPEIWQGPICIVNRNTQSTCAFKESLIKAVQIQSDSEHLSIVTFSGSNSYSWSVNLDSCTAEARGDVE